MSLACALWSKRDTLLALLDPFAARQFKNQWFVGLGLRREVEGVEAVDLREPRHANAALDVAPILSDTNVGRPARRLMRAKCREWGSLPSNPGDLSDRLRPALQRWIQERREPW